MTRAVRATIPEIGAGALARRLAFWSVLTAACGALAATAPAAAQTAPGSIEIGAESGRYIGGTLAQGTTAYFSGKAEVDEDVMRGFWLAARVSPNWTVEVTYRRSPTRIIGYAGGVWPEQPTLAGLDVTALEGVAQRCWRIGRFAPYLGGGVGLTNLDIDLGDKGRRNPTRGSLAAGGGARFYLTPWLGLRVDFRGRAAYLGERDPAYDRGLADTRRWYTSFEGMGGIFVALASW